MLRTLLAELDITLAIAGVESYRDLDRTALVRTKRDYRPRGPRNVSRRRA
jgi:hypothetical protein